jgi:hypothetical protein
MSGAPRKISALAALGSTLYALGACNAVLGMEEAELDQQTAALSCERIKRDPIADCAKDTCESCLTSCQDVDVKLQECLDSADCRKALMQYRTCSGDRCERKSACAGCLEAAGQPTAIRLGRCYEQCGGDCGPADIASLCDVYCACMHNQCSDNEPLDCVNACKIRQEQQPGIEEWRTYCFWYHCEAAQSPNDGRHCLHAVGELGRCGDADFPTGESTDVCNWPKAFKNGACNTNDDCCSGLCIVDQGACG